MRGSLGHLLVGVSILALHGGIHGGGRIISVHTNDD